MGVCPDGASLAVWGVSVLSGILPGRTAGRLCTFFFCNTPQGVAANKTHTIMKKVFMVLSGAAMFVLGGCSNDDEGVLTDPAALVGKWQEVKAVEYYKEDGKWYTDVEYDVNNPDHESNYGDDDLYFDYFEADGTYYSETYSKDGVLLGRGNTYTWSYENGVLKVGSYPVKVVVLTSSKLVTRDEWYDDAGRLDNYDLVTYRRVE